MQVDANAEWRGAQIFEKLAGTNETALYISDYKSLVMQFLLHWDKLHERPIKSECAANF